MRNSYKILRRKFERKNPLGRSKCRGEDNIEIGPKGIGYLSVHWIHLSYNRDQWGNFVNTIMNLRVPYNVRNLLSS